MPTIKKKSSTIKKKVMKKVFLEPDVTLWMKIHEQITQEMRNMVPKGESCPKINKYLLDLIQTDYSIMRYVNEQTKKS